MIITLEKEENSTSTTVDHVLAACEVGKEHSFVSTVNHIHDSAKEHNQPHYDPLTSCEENEEAKEPCSASLVNAVKTAKLVTLPPGTEALERTQEMDYEHRLIDK